MTSQRISEIPEAPAFYPTEQEFTEPLRYIESIAHIASKYGICKIIPPPSWKPPFALDSKNLRFRTRIQRLHALEASTRVKFNFLQGLYKFSCMLGKPVTRLPTLDKKTIDLYAFKTEVDRRGGYAIVTEERLWADIGRMLDISRKHCTSVSYNLRALYERTILPYQIFLERYSPSGTSQKLPTVPFSTLHPIPMPQGSNFNPFSEPDLPKPRPGEEICEVCHDINDPEKILLCDECDRGYHMRCLLYPIEEIPRGNWYCPRCAIRAEEYAFEDNQDDLYTFDSFHEKANRFKREYFSRLNIHDIDSLSEHDIEREYWRAVESPYEMNEVEYGADLHSSLHGSGFPSIERDPLNPYASCAWNLKNLPVSCHSLLRYISREIAGMMVPWLYLGMCFATFCWHHEDHYTSSINYLHLGSTKTWYGIPSSYAIQFEETMKASVPELFERQPDLLSQLVTLFSPVQLRDANVHVYRLYQHAGEFVVTYPQAYHAGFNQGFNVAEAVNFATLPWLESGFSCVERYRMFRKAPVFSHDELLCTIMHHIHDIHSARSLRPHIVRMWKNEMAHRDHVDKFASIHNICVKRRSIERCVKPDAEDELSCIHCHCQSYLSIVGRECRGHEHVCPLDIEMLTCKCSSIHLSSAAESSESCGTAISTNPCALVVKLRYTDEELRELVSQVETLSDVNVTWRDRLQNSLAYVAQLSLSNVEASQASFLQAVVERQTLEILQKSLDQYTEIHEREKIERPKSLGAVLNTADTLNPIDKTIDDQAKSIRDFLGWVNAWKMKAREILAHMPLHLRSPAISIQTRDLIHRNTKNCESTGRGKIETNGGVVHHRESLDIKALDSVLDSASLLLLAHSEEMADLKRLRSDIVEIEHQITAYLTESSCLSPARPMIEAQDDFAKQIMRLKESWKTFEVNRIVAHGLLARAMDFQTFIDFPEYEPLTRFVECLNWGMGAIVALAKPIDQTLEQIGAIANYGNVLLTKIERDPRHLRTTYRRFDSGRFREILEWMREVKDALRDVVRRTTLWNRMVQAVEAQIKDEQTVKVHGNQKHSLITLEYLEKLWDQRFDVCNIFEKYLLSRRLDGIKRWQRRLRQTWFRNDSPEECNVVMDASSIMKFCQQREMNGLPRRKRKRCVRCTLGAPIIEFDQSNRSTRKRSEDISSTLCFLCFMESDFADRSFTRLQGLYSELHEFRVHTPEKPMLRAYLTDIRSWMNQVERNIRMDGDTWLDCMHYRGPPLDLRKNGQFAANLSTPPNSLPAILSKEEDLEQSPLVHEVYPHSESDNEKDFRGKANLEIPRTKFVDAIEPSDESMSTEDTKADLGTHEIDSQAVHPRRHASPLYKFITADNQDEKLARGERSSFRQRRGDLFVLLSELLRLSRDASIISKRLRSAVANLSLDREHLVEEPLTLDHSFVNTFTFCVCRDDCFRTNFMTIECSSCRMTYHELCVNALEEKRLESPRPGFGNSQSHAKVHRNTLEVSPSLSPSPASSTSTPCALLEKLQRPLQTEMSSDNSLMIRQGLNGNDKGRKSSRSRTYICPICDPSKSGMSWIKRPTLEQLQTFLTGPPFTQFLSKYRDLWHLPAEWHMLRMIIDNITQWKECTVSLLSQLEWDQMDFDAFHMQTGGPLASSLSDGEMARGLDVETTLFILRRLFRLSEGFQIETLEGNRLRDALLTYNARISSSSMGTKTDSKRQRMDESSLKANEFNFISGFGTNEYPHEPENKTQRIENLTPCENNCSEDPIFQPSQTMNGHDLSLT